MKFRFDTLILTMIIAKSASASSLGADLAECFSSGGKTKAVCETDTKCSTENISIGLKSCLNAVGIDLTKCSAKTDSIECESDFVHVLVPQAKNMRLKISAKPSKNAVLLTDKPKSASFAGYEIKGTSIPISSAIKGKDGKWTLDHLGFPVGLEKLFTPDSVFVTKIVEEAEGPWRTAEGLDRCRSSLISEFDIEDGVRANVKKAFGTDELSGLDGKRHFFELPTNSSTALAFRFESKKPIKMCGSLIPKGSPLVAFVSNESCAAVTKGSISLSGFPLKTTPGIKALDGQDTRQIVCSPKAQRASNYQTLLSQSEQGKRPIVVPKLDWEECDCQIGKDD